MLFFLWDFCGASALLKQELGQRSRLARACARSSQDDGYEGEGRGPRVHRAAVRSPHPHEGNHGDGRLHLFRGRWDSARPQGQGAERRSCSLSRSAAARANLLTLFAVYACIVQDNADFIKIVLEKNGIVLGKTNVPEFAASLVTCNYANGCTLNPHDHALTSGGSSGGSGSAVGSYLAPVAVTEDTGGSTRAPAFSNGNFGYDPTRGHFPNAGNPGMALILDQLGLNARSIDDILLIDGAVSGYDPSTVKAKKISEFRVGVPRYPFVEAYIPEGGDNPYGYIEVPVGHVAECSGAGSVFIWVSAIPVYSGFHQAKLLSTP